MPAAFHDYWCMNTLQRRKTYFRTIGPRVVLGLYFVEYLYVMFGRASMLASVQVLLLAEALRRRT